MSNRDPNICFCGARRRGCRIGRAAILVCDNGHNVKMLLTEFERRQHGTGA